MNYFVTGTDTGVGKTFVSSLLIRSLRAAGCDTVGMKPICCGGREDAERLRASADFSISLDDVNPVWLRTAASPFTAAKLENREVDLDAIRTTFSRLRRERRSLVVEGVGGWLVPIQRDFFVSDLAAEMKLPILVVVANRLGALNHTLLTVRDIRTRGLNCAGLILNHLEPATDTATTTNRAVLETILDAPILFEVQLGQTELETSVA